MMDAARRNSSCPFSGAILPMQPMRGVVFDGRWMARGAAATPL